MSMLGEALRTNKKSWYRHNIDKNLCGVCGKNTPVVLEPDVPFVVFDKGDITIQRGRLASTCQSCLDKTKGENIMENLETSVKLNDFVSGKGPDEITIEVNDNTKPALEELLRMASYRQQSC